MTSMVTKYAAKKLLGKQMEKYKDKKVDGDKDPFFTLVENPRKPGKMKKVKKQVPDYIPEHDAIILAKMRQRAYWLDNSLFSLFGIRFGWSSVIGLIPGMGDAIDCALAIMLAWRASQVNCDKGGMFAQMIINCFLDLIIGLTPVLGDLADAAFKANTRNLRLLEKTLDKAYKPKSLAEADAAEELAAKKAHKKNYHPRPPATVYEDFSDEESERLPMHRQDIDPRQPEPARVATETRGGERPDRKKSLLKKDSKRERRSDVEMAESRSDRRY